MTIDSALCCLWKRSEKRLLRMLFLNRREIGQKQLKLMGISRRTLHRKLDRWPELVDTNNSVVYFGKLAARAGFEPATK